MDERICTKCLLKEISEKDYDNIKKYIDRILPDDRTGDILYENRLHICKECNLLNSGTCNACGCYVELRAASANSSCPRKKW